MAISLALAASPRAFAAPALAIKKPTTIYGQDGRKDLFEVHDARALKLADSTVALFKSRKVALKPSTGMATLDLISFQKKERLCPGERFADQWLGADCTGALIGPDLILTAGHCVKSQTNCDGTMFVFGFSITEEGKQPRQIPLDEIYQCKELIHSQYDNEGPDFALVRLDRAVEKHEPLALNEGEGVSEGAPLLVVGHPSGLPAKIADGARVRSTRGAGYFVANTDTFGGNSGSPVFNEDTGLIEGVLVRGDEDFVPNSEGACYTAFRCADDDCRGEDATNISEVIKRMAEKGITR
jgi:hypothetical protein